MFLKSLIITCRTTRRDILRLIDASISRFYDAVHPVLYRTTIYQVVLISSVGSQHRTLEAIGSLR